MNRLNYETATVMAVHRERYELLVFMRLNATQGLPDQAADESLIRLE